ncbi:cadherin repeat domain-containing protein [Jannaschia seohaensis]|uniref:Cadherin domain-containing protein n=1 Tax=Jannaschia seohaensis TaxID=475081 RepID=A0A2Y9B0D7_9RHOB|nr:cadherin repeat domain-containing protein [Jannaschia seohaensis]PWJ14997.1 hypothetical protein BCF38_11112 [Jannaschia seohaensis]SSA49846.1 hypothetical protein SAMN05421539_11112 [Jannaschia seohaensis]
MVLAGALDFEASENFEITVEVSDGALTALQTFTIEVEDVNEAPPKAGLLTFS